MTSSDSKKRKRVNFGVSAAPGSLVFVAGTFNDWNPTANPMQENGEEGKFKADMLVPHGKHEYKFVVNGIWTDDPACQNRVPSPFGSENCVLQTPEAEKISKDEKLCRKK